MPNYAGIKNPVFNVPDGTDTPILQQGWTVQSAQGGSDQGTVDGKDMSSG